MNKKTLLILTGALVVLISLFFIITLVTKTPIEKTLLDGYTAISTHCLAVYPDNNNAYRDCYYSENYNLHQKLKRGEWVSYFLAFGLPILFFGSMGLHKFAFRKKKKK